MAVAALVSLVTLAVALIDQPAGERTALEPAGLDDGGAPASSNRITLRRIPWATSFDK